MKLTYGGKLDRPNVCFLCETTPDHGTKVIDTERYFDGHPFNLQGRRYVCEKCINSMLVYFDLATHVEVERAQAELSRSNQVIRGMKQRIDVLFNDLRYLVENPTALTEVSSEPVREAVASSVGDREGEDGTSGTENSSISGGRAEVEGTFSGASLSTSPYAQ